MSDTILFGGAQLINQVKHYGKIHALLATHCQLLHVICQTGTNCYVGIAYGMGGKTASLPVCCGFLSTNYVQVSGRALSQGEQEIIQTFREFLQRKTHRSTLAHAVHVQCT